MKKLDNCPKDILKKIGGKLPDTGSFMMFGDQVSEVVQGVVAEKLFKKFSLGTDYIDKVRSILGTEYFMPMVMNNKSSTYKTNWYYCSANGDFFEFESGDEVLLFISKDEELSFMMKDKFLRQVGLTGSQFRSKLYKEYTEAKPLYNDLMNDLIDNIVSSDQSYPPNSLLMYHMRKYGMEMTSGGKIRVPIIGIKENISMFIQEMTTAANAAIEQRKALLDPYLELSPRLVKLAQDELKYLMDNEDNVKLMGYYYNLGEEFTKVLKSMDSIFCDFSFEDDPDVCSLFDLIMHEIDIETNGPIAVQDVKYILNRWSEVLMNLRPTIGEQTNKLCEESGKVRDIIDKTKDDKILITDFIVELCRLSEYVHNNTDISFRLGEWWGDIGVEVEEGDEG